MSTAVSIRMSDEIAHELEGIIRTMDRSGTYIIRKVIESYLLEYVDYSVTIKRLTCKDAEIISSNEMRNRLGDFLLPSGMSSENHRGHRGRRENSNSLCPPRPLWLIFFAIIQSTQKKLKSHIALPCEIECKSSVVRDLKKLDTSVARDAEKRGGKQC